MISVGILSAPAISVSFSGAWTTGGERLKESSLTVSVPTKFVPLTDDATFTLHDVVIGIGYHWERREDQTFRGTLDIIKEGDRLTAVNVLPVEDYLVSVISSEMKPTAHLEFLKAAAVISRSWAVRQKQNRQKEHPAAAQPDSSDAGIYIRWFDRQDHTLYDVCADDHCQRYQGIMRITNPNAALAVSQTAHQVLTCGGEVCDCRFSKCCGGMTENFATCWEDVEMPYLRPVSDTDPNDGHVFCNTSDKAVLSQVLNSYDLETTDFYRWTEVLTQQQLQDLLKRKLGRDFGQIKALRPVRSGRSGRISQLLIEGTAGSLVIGKELTIRSALSESHLYSSAFTVETEDTDGSGIPLRFTLHGKGWGHGVGLCQIGAAVMANEGYTYSQILQHYYPGTTLTALQD
jgi:SpoIID/LytB domain protein